MKWWAEIESKARKIKLGGGKKSFENLLEAR